MTKQIPTADQDLIPRIRVAAVATLSPTATDADREHLRQLEQLHREQIMQWRAQHPEEVEKQERERREKEEDEIDIADTEARIVAQSGYEAATLFRYQHESRMKAEGQQFEARQGEQQKRFKAGREAKKQHQRADRAEAGQTPRGVPFDETSLATKPNGYEFTPADFCEALKREEEHAGAIRRALSKWDDGKGKGTKRGTRWTLTHDEAKAFWDWHNRAKHKAHPQRAKKQNSAPIARAG